MAKVKKRTFSLPQDQSDYIDTKLAAGGYASSSEIVREGLRMLQEKDFALERWLSEEVLPTYDRWKAGEEKTYSSDEVFEELFRITEEDKKDKAAE